MKIAVLMENTSCREDLAWEHGLSLYIETGGKKILFDAGQSGAFANNAEKLGIGLEEVDFCVLSHGHYDHGGGLKRFLEINDHAPVYASPLAFGIHYHGETYIGLDQSLDRSRFRFPEDRRVLAPGIWIDPCGSRFENAGSQGMQVMEGERFVPERFRHEQYLVVEEQGKRYVFSGCSHRGLENILSWLQPQVFLGGFHLSKVEQEARIRAIAGRLAQRDTLYATGHCTGRKQFAWMQKDLGQRLLALTTGTLLEL